MSNKKLVSFRLPDNLMNSLREKADHDGISVTELVCRLLKQGLQPPPQMLPQTDDRIASLESEVQELRQSRPSLAPTPLYALLTQGAIVPDNESEMRTRLTRLEQMMETLMTQNSVNPIVYPQEPRAAMQSRPDE